jgi:hypothetical protein
VKNFIDYKMDPYVEYDYSHNFFKTDGMDSFLKSIPTREAKMNRKSGKAVRATVSGTVPLTLTESINKITKSVGKKHPNVKVQVVLEGIVTVTYKVIGTSLDKAEVEAFTQDLVGKIKSAIA